VTAIVTSESPLRAHDDRGVARSQVAITTFSGLYLADFSVEGQQPGAPPPRLLNSRWPSQAA